MHLSLCLSEREREQPWQPLGLFLVIRRLLLLVPPILHLDQAQSGCDPAVHELRCVVVEARGSGQNLAGAGVGAGLAAVLQTKT